MSRICFAASCAAAVTCCHVRSVLASCAMVVDGRARYVVNGLPYRLEACSSSQRMQSDCQRCVSRHDRPRDPGRGGAQRWVDAGRDLQSVESISRRRPLLRAQHGEFMINLRVDDLGRAARPAPCSAGAQVRDRREDSADGQFGYVVDPRWHACSSVAAARRPVDGRGHSGCPASTAVNVRAPR